MSTANAKAAVEAMLVAAAIADDAIADLRDALATLKTQEEIVWRELLAVRHHAVGNGYTPAPTTRRGINLRGLELLNRTSEPDLYATVLAAWAFLEPTEPE